MQFATFDDCLLGPTPWQPWLVNPDQHGDDMVNFWLALVPSHLRMTSWSESSMGDGYAGDLWTSRQDDTGITAAAHGLVAVVHYVDLADDAFARVEHSPLYVCCV